MATYTNITIEKSKSNNGFSNIEIFTLYSNGMAFWNIGNTYKNHTELFNQFNYDIYNVSLNDVKKIYNHINNI